VLRSPRVLAASILVLGVLLGCVLVFPRLLLKVDVDRSRLDRMAPAEYAKAVNEIRTTLLQGIGGVVLLAGVYVTWRQLQENIQAGHEQRDLDRQGQITERFTRAVEQLANERLAIQLGGISALDRIAAESPRDRKAIVDILAAAIRTQSPWPPPAQNPFPADYPIAKVPPMRVRAPSVQSALNVVGRWGPTPAQEQVWPTADLTDADLRMANLEGAHLWRVRLHRANLAGANLSGADLRGADLTEAVLVEADLQEAVADATTWWPSGFQPLDAGVVVQRTSSGGGAT